MANELRVAGNRIGITGVVKEIKGFGKEPMKIEQYDVKDENGEKTGEKYNAINGSIVISTGEGSDHEVKISFLREFNKSGSENKKFNLLKKFIDGEYKTLANAKEGEEATQISIWGSDGSDFVPHIEENRYGDTENEITKTNPEFKLGFGNMNIPKEPLEEKDFIAEFDVEVFVEKIEEETKKNEEGDEEETGRLKLRGWMPLYGGDIMPLDFIIPQEVKDENDEVVMTAEDFENAVSEGDTVNLFGKIDNRTIITKESHKGGIGKVKTKTKKEFIHELVVEGADFPSEKNQYEEEDIRSATKERKVRLDEVLEKAKQREEEKANKPKQKGLGDKPKSDKGNKTRKFDF